jgi:uncharacterized protein (TIGR02646 family)
MMGQHQRCMYCVDSHGCDIEHFHPKAAFPHWMYRWANLLLCCTECGRLKGDRFPMQGDQALLIDPTSEEPWHFLDFDPDTGNLTACFELASNAESIKGQATTTLLQLDQREALAAGYQRTWRRLQKSLRHFLEAPSSADTLIANLLEADDHGLIGWCFKGNGQHEPLLTTLRQQHPAIWNACLQKFTFY